jgi:hypothetical protein
MITTLATSQNLKKKKKKNPGSNYYCGGLLVTLPIFSFVTNFWQIALLD